MKKLWCVAVVVVTGCSARSPVYREVLLCELSQPADFAFSGTVTSVGPAPSIIGKPFITVSAAIDETLWGTVPSQLVMATECNDVLGKPGSYFTSIDFHGTVVLVCLERKGADVESVVTSQTWPAATFEADLFSSRSGACVTGSGPMSTPVVDGGP